MKKRLKDQLNYAEWEQSLPPRGRGNWMRDELPPAADHIRMVETEAKLDVACNPKRHNAVAKMKALKFISLIKSGMPAWRAAKNCHTTIKTLMTHEECRKLMANLIQAGTMSAEARKMMVRAGLNVTFLQGTRADATDEEKDRMLKAAKLIGADPEVGLEAPPIVNNNVLVLPPELREILDNTEVIDVPVIEPKQLEGGEEDDSGESEVPPVQEESE